MMTHQTILWIRPRLFISHGETI